MKNSALALGLTLLLCACGDTGSFRAAIRVSVSPTTAQLHAGQSQQFAATVSNTGNAGVTWTLAGQGTITANGLYTAPAEITATTTATIAATSMADLSKSGQALITLLPAVSVSPSTASVNVAATQQFTADVGLSDQRVTWSISGPGCTGDACGSITTNGLFTAPWCVPDPPTIIITATSAADTTKFSTATVTPVLAGSQLQGQYAFSYQGTGSSGMMQAAGTFVADGNGHLTGGLEDTVGDAGVNTNVTFSGSYSSSCYCRGTMTLNDSLGGVRTYGYALNLAGNRGRLIELDTTGSRATGLLAKQDTSSFALSKTAGGFAFGYSGRQGLLARAGLIGQFQADGAGNVTSGNIDINVDGTTLANGTLSGTYTLSISTGRGTATLTAAAPVSQTYHLAYYMVSADEAFWISVDAPGASTPYFGGRVLRQSGGPFALASLNAEAAFNLTGKTPAGLQNSDVAAGLITPDGGGNITAGMMDENYDTVVSSYATLSGTYTVDAGGKGRGTMHLDMGSGVTRDVTFYLVSPNTAFLLDGTGSVAGPNTGVGYMEARSGAPYSTASFQGTYYLGTWGMATSYVPVLAGVAIANGGGQIAGMGDESDIFSNYHNVALFVGSYSVPANGRIAFGPMVFYMISPSKGLVFEVDDTQHQPSVIMIEQ